MYLSPDKQQRIKILNRNTGRLTKPTSGTLYHSHADEFALINYTQRSEKLHCDKNSLEEEALKSIRIYKRHGGVNFESSDSSFNFK